MAIYSKECSLATKPNPYWERITEIQNRQRLKGLYTYGQTLEENTTPGICERIHAIEEELIDALMYLEWVLNLLIEQGDGVIDRGDEQIE